MAKVTTVQVFGLADLEKKLYELPTELAKKFMRQALRASAGIWLKEFRATAPREDDGPDAGFLQSQAAMTTKLSAKYDTGEANVGFRKRQYPNRKAAHRPTAANVARWLERGTVKMPPHPFMLKAFQSRSQQVFQKFHDVLKDGLKQVFNT